MATNSDSSKRCPRSTSFASPMKFVITMFWASLRR